MVFQQPAAPTARKLAACIAPKPPIKIQHPITKPKLLQRQFQLAARVEGCVARQRVEACIRHSGAIALTGRSSTICLNDCTQCCGKVRPGDTAFIARKECTTGRSFADPHRLELADAMALHPMNIEKPYIGLRRSVFAPVRETMLQSRSRGARSSPQGRVAGE